MAGWVLGCHRSGTSLLCSIVRSCVDLNHQEVLGGDIPTTLANPIGHHESEAICNSNDLLLQWARSAWDRPFITRPAWEHPDSLNLISELRSNLKMHASHQAWIDKDPRLCLTREAYLHLWLRDIAAIAILRDPLAVAESLYRRDGFSLRKSAVIWTLYNLHLFNSRCKPPEAIVLFDQLVSNKQEDRLQIAGYIEIFLRRVVDAETDRLYDEELLRQRVLSEIERQGQQSLVRSQHAWTDPSDQELRSYLADFWERIKVDAVAQKSAELGNYFRHAWADCSPWLQNEIGIPLRRIDLHPIQEQDHHIRSSKGLLKRLTSRTFWR